MMTYISCQSNQGAGIGHQFADWATGYILAKRYNLTFAHQPFAIWENFLGFGEGEIQFKDLVGNHIVKVPMLDLDSKEGIARFEQFIANAKDGDVLHLALDQNMSSHAEIEPFAKEKYWKLHQPATCYQAGKTKVGVHIRRGDIVRLPRDEMLSRFQPNSYYLQQIDKVAMSSPNLDIHIFSEGDVADFQGFGSYTLHINESQFETFNNLTSADILILSRSGFSYFAGMVSYGLKIASSGFWHKYPKEWIW